jgi:hypothetical protein
LAWAEIFRVLGHMLKPIERQSFFAVIWGGDFKTITCGQAIDAQRIPGF